MTRKKVSPTQKSQTSARPESNERRLSKKELINSLITKKIRNIRLKRNIEMKLKSILRKLYNNIKDKIRNILQSEIKETKSWGQASLKFNNENIDIKKKKGKNLKVFKV